MTILIADSSEHIINMYEKLIIEVDNQSEIYKAMNVTETLRIFDVYKPQVILLDMHFTENKSIDLLKHMKKNWPKSYVIALSVYESVINREQCKQLGADCCLDKYDEFDQIPGIIKGILQ